MANEKQIWDYLKKKTHNAYGAAAIMGNLMAESSLNPKAVAGVKDPDYVSNSDAGLIDFANDGHAFGLAQWVLYTRKEALITFAKGRNVSVGDLQMQLEYLIDEMINKYKTIWNAVIWAKSIRDTSDAVMLKYINPANTSEKARQRRTDLGQKFYNKFANEESTETPVDSRDVIYLVLTDMDEIKKAIIKEDRINIQIENSPQYIRLFLPDAE